jgi:glucose/arabinose dehydrogenase
MCGFMTRNQRFAGLYLSICGFLVPMELARAQAPAAAQRTEARSVPAPKWVEMIDQGEADPRLKGIRTPRGIKVEIVAAEPAVENPVAMAFGEDGTLIVLERTLSQEKPELLKELRDIDGDSVYEESRVLMSDLSLASGLLMNGGWIYWTSEGRVLRRRAYDAKLLKESQVSADDKTGPATKATADGKWIDQELIHGLSAIAPYQAGGLALGPDGWLYVSAGSGEQRAESWDGSTAAVVRSGAVFRFRPDGSQLHEYCRGLRQPTGGIAFDPWGNAFAADMDWLGDKLTGTRLLHVLEGGDYGWQHAKTAAARPDQVRADAWVETRDKSCAFYYDYFQGSMANPMMANCDNRETALRAIFLMGFADDMAGWTDNKKRR